MTLLQEMVDLLVAIIVVVIFLIGVSSFGIDLALGDAVDFGGIVIDLILSR